MKIKRRICGTLACLSIVWLLGVAGNSDSGAEPDPSVLIIKVLCGLLVLIASVKLGGLTK